MVDEADELNSVLIDAPVQDVWLELKNSAELDAWIESQRQHWQQIKMSLPNAVVSGQALSLDPIYRNIDHNLKQIRKEISQGNIANLENFLNNARRLGVILAEGNLARAIKQFIARKETGAAAALILQFNSAYTPDSMGHDQRLEIGLARATSFHPATQLLDNTNEIKQAAKFAAELREAYREAKKFIETSQTEFDKMKEVYHADIKLRAPAEYWREKEKDSRNAAIMAFGTFVIFLFAAGYLASIVADDLMKFAHKHAGSDLTILAGFVIVAVPVAAVAWVLKHISRVYVQSLAVASDSSFRRSLILTYLALVQDLKEPMDEKDRALILNALFRPGPTDPQDEGPPTGLIEMFRSPRG